MTSRDPWKGLRANAVLRSLPPHDALLLGQSLKRVTVLPGDRLTPFQTDLVYFPETVVVCQVGRGSHSAVAMIGREGLIGWDRLFQGAEPSGQFFVALTGGSALVASGSRLRALMLRHSSLTISLMPYLQDFVMQMANTILTTLHGTLEARLCTWLLMMHARVDGDELRITHEALGEFLKVRRASVTDSLHVLEGERALRCTRGRVVVLDPAGLRQRAGPACIDVGIPADALSPIAPSELGRSLRSGRARSAPSVAALA